MNEAPATRPALFHVRDERPLLFNCATCLKYPMPAAGRSIGLREPVDFAALAQ